MTGRYYHSIDAKGRLFVPARIRDELPGVFHLAPGSGTCLTIYSERAWNRLVERYEALPYAQGKGLRTFFANTARCELDAQGRIVISKDLIQYACLNKETVIIGVEDRAEIWDKELWAQEEGLALTPEKVEALMGDIGL